MEQLWNKLQIAFRNGSISKQDAILYKKWEKALKFLSEDPNREDFTIIGLDPHPESSKNGAYDRVELSKLPK